ncbi:MAG: hypothetical protein LBQ46_00775, partial [Treponema sp.]|nr:hypothetical protein [Treponema sp.]
MTLRLYDHWYSLNGRLKLCGFVAVLGIAGVTIFSFAASWRSAYRDAYDFFRQAEAEMDSRLNTALDEIQTIARNVGYSIPVQRFL